MGSVRGGIDCPLCCSGLDLDCMTEHRHSCQGSPSPALLCCLLSRHIHLRDGGIARVLSPSGRGPGRSLRLSGPEPDNGEGSSKPAFPGSKNPGLTRRAHAVRLVPSGGTRRCSRSQGPPLLPAGNLPPDLAKPYEGSGGRAGPRKLGCLEHGFLVRGPQVRVRVLEEPGVACSRLCGWGGCW